MGKQASNDDKEERFIRALSGTLSKLAELEGVGDSAAERRNIVEATLATNDEVIRAVLLGQLVLAKKDLDEEEGDDEGDDDEDDEDEDDDY